MASEAALWSRFFLAVPEATLEDALLDYLKARGLINEAALLNVMAARAALKKAGVIRSSLKGKSLLGRLMAIAPEVITRQSVDVLSKFGLIDRADADLLKLALRFGAIGKGGLARPAVIMQRLKKVFGIGFANDALNLSVSMGFLTHKEADTLKAGLYVSQSTLETLEALRNAKNLQNVMMLVANGVINSRNINAMRLAGLLDNRTANAILEALDYGTSMWTVFEGAKKAEGYAARLAYVISGTFSHEAMDVLKAVEQMNQKELEKLGIGWMYGKLTPERMLLLEMATHVSQKFNRGMMEQLTMRRYRVIPGESPIVSFARSSKMTEDEILQLLSKSAADARKRARLLAGTARGAEYNIAARGLHQSMRQLWEGNGFLTIFGEHDVADAAFESANMLEKKYYDHMPQPVAQMLQFQAKSGLDSFISRKENTHQLSRLIYGNMNLWTGKVDQQVNMGLLQGQSANEIANRVSNMINPSVPGGVRYAALRIGRTEVANAFHQTTIRYSREMPWVKGYMWNLSKSHGHSDTCDEYAAEDHDGLGPGIFKKANVPGKPHPQCMCFVTVVQVDEKTFINNWNKGYYDQYLASKLREPASQDTMWSAIRETGLRIGGVAASQVALSGAGLLAEKMVMNGAPKITGFNYAEFAGKTRAAVKAKIASIHNAYKPAAEAIVSSDVTDKVAKIVEAKVSDEDLKLISRQTAFKKMEAQAVATNIRFRDAGNALTEEESIIANSALKRGTTPAIEQHYLDLLPEERPGLPIRLITTDNPIEDLSKSIYGKSSYRTMNARLRIVNGDLDAYDEMFADGPTFFEKTGEVIKGLKAGDAVAARMNLNQMYLDFMEKDVVKSATKAFGNRYADISTYYEQLLEDGLDEFGEGYAKIKAHSDIIKALDQSMEPIKKDGYMWRVSGYDWTGLDHVPGLSDIGHVFKDDAFTSIEGRPDYFNGGGGGGLAFEKRGVRFQMLTPAGTMASRVNAHENELIMSRGTKYQIIGVTDGAAGFAKTVQVAIIDQDDVWSKAKEFFLRGDEDDMWDTIMGEF